MSLKTKTYPCAEIEKLDVNCTLYKIRVVESSSDMIEISWHDTAKRNLELKLENRTLKILDHAAIGIYNTLALIDLKKDAQLLIKLPKSYTGKAIFQSKEEPVHLSSLTSEATIGVASSTGEILLENVCCSQLDIRGHQGKINCYSLDTTGSINISSKNGAINCNLLGSESDYTVSCNTSNRRCTVNGVTGQGDKKVQLNSEHGEIRFTFQNGVSTSKPTSRYDRKNAFQEW